MKYNLYAIQDTMIGFTLAQVAKNDELALRDYHNFLNATPNAEYMRFYKVGTFDDSTGTVIGINPVCLEGGMNNGGEVQNAD